MHAQSARHACYTAGLKELASTILMAIFDCCSQSRKLGFTSRKEAVAARYLFRRVRRIDENAPQGVRI